MRSLVEIDAAQTVLIDGLQGETFFIFLVTSIEQMWVKNVSPGQRYVFLLRQGAAGGQTVAWGSSFTNGSAVDPRPHSTTLQSFIADSDGTLEAFIPGTSYL